VATDTSWELADQDQDQDDDQGEQMSLFVAEQDPRMWAR
jgi:hypothetical protein